MSKKDKKAEVASQENLNAGSSPKVIVKKRGGCGTFFLGFMFSFILLIAVIVGGGLYLYYNMNMKTVENMVGLQLPFEGDLKEMSIKELLTKTDQLVNASIYTLENDFGVTIPDTIPGTDLSLSETYEETITFRGNEVKVKDVRIQDMVNYLDEFVDQVLPVLYKHITIGQIMSTAKTTILDDLGYPALVEEFYNIGTESAPVYKSLSQMTIDEALDYVPAYFSQDTLTVQQALDAFGVDLLPAPEAGQDDVYATLRNIKIKDLNVENLTTQIKGEVLNKLVDLSAYDFTQTEEFNKTTIKELGNFMLTLSLGEFVTIEGVITDADKLDEFLQEPQFSAITKDTSLSDVKDLILGLNLNQILSTSDILAIETVYAGAGEMTVQEFFVDKPEVDFDTLTGGIIQFETYGTYVEILGASTAHNYEQNIKDASTYDLLGGSDWVSPIAGLCDLTLKQITESENAVSLLLENFGTLGDLVGSEPEGLFSIISDVSIQDLLDRPSEAITEKLESSTKTLGELLNSTSSGDNKIIQKVMSIEVGELFQNGGSAMTDALSAETFGSLLGITDTTGFMSLLKNVNFGALMGDNAKGAILDALTNDGSNDTTLGTFLNISSADGVLGKMINIKMKDLIGNSTTTANPTQALNEVIDGLTIKDVFGELPASPTTTGDKILTELYGMTPTNSGSMLVSEVFNNVENLKVSTILGSAQTGILSLIKADSYNQLTIKNINSNAIEFRDNITLRELIALGVVSAATLDENDPIMDKTIQEIINEYIAIKNELI